MAVILRKPVAPRPSMQRRRFPPTVGLSLVPSLTQIVANISTTEGTFTRWRARIKKTADPDIAGSWSAWANKAATDASHAFTGLDTGTGYDVQAVGFDHEFQGPSASASAMTSNVAPPAPSVSLTPGDTTLRVGASVPEGTALTKWQRRTGTGGSWTDIASTSRAITFTVVGLTNGTRYTIQVRAVNATATGATGQAQASPVAPSTPGAPSVSLVPSDTTIAISASAPANTSFSDWQWRVGNGSWQTVSHNNSALNVTASGLTNGQAYTISVRLRHRGAVTTVNGATASETATPVAPAKPPAPSVTLTPGDQEIGVQASVASSVTVTDWQWRAATSGSWTTINSSSTSITFSVTGLTNGTEATIQVRARNQGPVTLQTGDHTQKKATPKSPISTAAPPAPSLTLTPGDRQIGIAAAVAGSPRVTSWQWRVGSGDWTEVASTSVTFAATATGLVNGTKYSISVRALNDAASVEGAATTKSATPFLGLGKPSLLVSGGNRRVTLSASITGTVGAWQYRIATTANALSAASWMDVSQASGTLSYVVTGLSADSTYFAQVRASFGTKFSSPSDVESADTLDSTPAQPSLTVEPGDTTVRLIASTSGPKVTGWQYRLNPSSSWQTVSGASGLSLRHTITGLTNDTTYRIAVRAINGTAASSPSVTREARPTPKLFSGSGTNGDPYRLAVPLSRFVNFQNLLAPTNYLRSATETVHGIQNVCMVIEILPTDYSKWIFDLDFANLEQDFDLRLFGRIGGTWTQLDSSTTTTDDENVGRTFDELYVDRIRLLVIPAGGWDVGNPGGVTTCRLKIGETAQTGNRQTINLPATHYGFNSQFGRKGWGRTDVMASALNVALDAGLRENANGNFVGGVLFDPTDNWDAGLGLQFSIQNTSADFRSKGSVDLSAAGHRILGRVGYSRFRRDHQGVTFGSSDVDVASMYSALPNSGGSGSVILRDYDPLPPPLATQSLNLPDGNYGASVVAGQTRHYWSSLGISPIAAFESTNELATTIETVSFYRTSTSAGRYYLQFGGPSGQQFILPDHTWGTLTHAGVAYRFTQNDVTAISGQYLVSSDALQPLAAALSGASNHAATLELRNQPF